MRVCSLFAALCYRTIDDSRKAVETTHAELHATGDDASRAEANDVKMEGAENDDDSDHKNALENGLMSPTSSHTEHSAVRGAFSLWVNSFECV